MSIIFKDADIKRCPYTFRDMSFVIVDECDNEYITKHMVPTTCRDEIARINSNIGPTNCRRGMLAKTENTELPYASIHKLIHDYEEDAGMSLSDTVYVDEHTAVFGLGGQWFELTWLVSALSFIVRANSHYPIEYKSNEVLPGSMIFHWESVIEYHRRAKESEYRYIADLDLAQKAAHGLHLALRKREKMKKHGFVLNADPEKFGLTGALKRCLI